MPSREKKPNLVSKYIEDLRGVTRDPGTYAYRGQGNAIWAVESAASRRIRKTWETPPNNLPDTETFIRYHEDDLLAPARMDGYGAKDGRVLSDLELLAELQHFGTATCLIDFTANFLAALWFACYEGETTGKNDGKVCVLNINNHFRSLKQADLGKEIRPIIKMEMVKGPDKPSYWYWAPHGMNPRILKQDSLFVFGKAGVADDHLKFIPIEKEDKNPLLRELEKLGVSRESLFKDLPGFASANTHLDLIPRLKASVQGLFSAGNEAFQQGDWERAIRLYNDAESKKEFKEFPQKASLLRSRGFANFRMGNHEAASEDYTQSMVHEPNSFTAYHHRGVAKYNMKNYGGAVKDFAEALNKNPNSALTIFWRAFAYENLGKTTESRNDLDRALMLAKRIKDNQLVEAIQKKLSEYEAPPSEDIPF